MTTTGRSLVRPQDAASLLVYRRARPASELLPGEWGAFRSPAHARALAMAAVRETAEETGLVLGVPGYPGPVGGGWDIFRALGVAPPLHRLRWVDPHGSIAAGLIDVTEAILAEVGPCPADPVRPPLFLSYRRQRCYLRRERPGS